MTKTDLSMVSDLLKRIRAINGWNQSEMARHLDLTRTSVVNIENGRQDLPASRLLALLVQQGFLVDPEHPNPTIRDLVHRLDMTVERLAEAEARLHRYRRIFRVINDAARELEGQSGGA